MVKYFYNTEDFCQKYNNRNINGKTLKLKLEAFSVNNGWASFVIFGLGDPHSLEG